MNSQAKRKKYDNYIFSINWKNLKLKINCSIHNPRLKNCRGGFKKLTVNLKKRGRW